MANNSYVAAFAMWGKKTDGAFKAIKSVLFGTYDYFKSPFICVTTALTSLHVFLLALKTFLQVWDRKKEDRFRFVRRPNLLH